MSGILGKSKYDAERKALGIPSWYSGELKKDNEETTPSWYSGQDNKQTGSILGKSSGSILAKSKYDAERQEYKRDWDAIKNSIDNPSQTNNSGRDWDSINKAAGLFNQPAQEVKPSSGGLFNKTPQEVKPSSGGLFNKELSTLKKESSTNSNIPQSKFNLPSYNPDSPENQPKNIFSKITKNLQESQIKKEYETRKKDYEDLKKGKLNIDTFGLSDTQKSKALADYKQKTTELGSMSFDQFRLYKYQNEENPNWKPSSNPENRVKFIDTGSKIGNFAQRTLNKGVNTLTMDDRLETPSTNSKIGDFASDTAGTILGYLAPVPGMGGTLQQMSTGISKPVENAITKKIVPKLTNAAFKKAPNMLAYKAAETGAKLLPSMSREFIEGGALAGIEGAARNMKPKDIAKKIAIESSLGALLGGGIEEAGLLKNSAFKTSTSESKLGLTSPKGKAFQTPETKLKKAQLNDYYNNIDYQDYINSLDPKFLEAENAFRRSKGLQPLKDIESTVTPIKEIKPILNKKLEPVLNEVDATTETPNLKNNTLVPPLLKPLDNSVSEAGTKVRGFKNNLLDNGSTLPGLKKELKKADINYNPITNEETLKKAKDLINTDYNQAIKIAKGDLPATAESNTISQLLIQKAQHEGRWEDAIDLVEITAKKATSQGQAIQALSMWGRLSSEGMLRYTQNVIDKANRARPDLNLKLKPEVAKEITEGMNNISKMVEGREKTVAIAKVLDKVTEQVPPTLLKKISTIQTMAQLLNPKTGIRNLVGNTGFLALENMSDVVGTGIDKAVSTITGQRTKILPSLLTQAKGFKTGWKLGLEDAVKGIDTAKLPTQFDISTKTFRKGLLGKLETGMNIELKAPDRAFYQAAYDNSLRTQMKIAKVEAPTEAMKEVAHLDGLYRTFQDDNVISKAFSGVKRILNNGKEFGIGDFIIKYPKTPGSILHRGIQYSPAGFVRTTIDLAKMVSGKSINQKQFVESTSRALVGSVGLVGTGALLNKLGIITGKSSDDKDVRNMQSELGLGDYKINVTGLKRFIFSGFNPEEAAIRKGDTLANYDWFMPNAMGLAIGADINQNKGGTTGTIGSIASALQTGTDTIAEQPVLQGIKRFAQNSNQSVTTAFTEMAKGVPASFVPTLLNQVRQLVDNQSRNTYDPNWVKESGNMVKAKMPGLSKTLQPLITPLGKNKEVYKNGSNTPFNVLLNPAFVNKYNPTPGQELALNIYNQSGLKTQMPKVMDKKLIRKGETYTLTPQEYKDLQQYVGEETAKKLEALGESEYFKAAEPELQAKKIEKLIDAIYQQGKKKVVFQPRGIK